MAVTASRDPALEDVGFELRRFVGSAGLLSLGSIASFARALVTAKLFAITLGPSLVGILAQLLNFSALVSVIVPLGLTTGAVKMVAERRDDPDATDRVVGTACLLSVVSGSAASLLLLPVAGQVSVALTGSDRYSLLVALIVLSFPLYNLAGAASYVLQGFSDVRRLTRAAVANAVIALALLIPATLLLGLLGAALSVLLSSITQSFLYCLELALAYRRRGRSFLRVRAAAVEARRLLQFGVILLTGSFAIWAALLVVRTLLVHSLGQYQNGLYQAAYGLSNQYITIFMTWMAAYVVPRIAARGPGRVGELLAGALRANLFIMVPVLVLAAALREPLVRLFYSPQFLPAAGLIPIQVLGDYARIVGWSLAASLFPLGRTRAHLALIAGQSVLWVALTALLLPWLRLPAVSVAYAVSFVVWAPAAYVMLRRWFDFRLTRVSLELAGCGLACVLAAILLPRPIGVLVVPVMPLVVLATGRWGAPRWRGAGGA
jgi:O-antigen/teichoic acid export membrane protein